MTALNFDGVLYFPLTPFADDGSLDLASYERHVSERLTHGPGAVFPACGTGELHALSVEESSAVVRATVDASARIPVVAGVGGSLPDAIARARAAEEAGADAILILPPYLVSGPVAGTIAYATAVLRSCSLPAIVYNRGTARYPASAMRVLAEDPQVIGFKDGVGDIAAVQETVLAVRRAGRDDFLFFNGLLTAELSQGAYRGIGVPLYSSAAFAMAPETAIAHYEAYRAGDEDRRLTLLDTFYRPLAALRDEVPGFGVALIKAGARLRGEAMGSVRPPLVDPDERQTRILGDILEAGRQLVASWA